MRYFITFSYDGSDFKGYQKQPRGKTVQNEVEKVLKKINNDTAVPIHGSGSCDFNIDSLSLDLWSVKSKMMEVIFF